MAIELSPLEMSTHSSASPTFDELAEQALAQMQREQREQQKTIDTQLRVVPQAVHPTAWSLATPSNSHSSQRSPSTPSSSSTPVPHNPNTLPSLPTAPQEESVNAEMSELNESVVAVLVAQQKANQLAQQSLSSVLHQQFQSLSLQQQKLALVQAELQKLDQTLSDNISVLRNEIETVGREVSYLQQTFDVAEKAYLSARAALAKKKQRKLLLQQHLNSLILSNEKDKANKLHELHSQLGLALPSGTSASSPGVARLSATIQQVNGHHRSSVTPQADSNSTQPPSFQGFS